MKRLLVLLLLISSNTTAQTLLVRDNMENPSGFRGISSFINSTFTGGLSSAVDNPPNYPMYSSSDSCYVIKGTGLGSSAVETDTFTYPNLPIVNGRRYQIRYKIASFGLNYSIQTAAGVDQTDWIEMQYTVNNGLSWWRDAQVQGISNSMWSFDGAIGTNAKLNITRTGSMSTTTPIIYTSNASNPVVNVWVTLPVTNINMVRIRFITNINAIGEMFMLDDVEVWDITATLPVELLEFKGNYYNNGLKLSWSTASEINNDYFVILKSFDGINYQELMRIKGRGNSNSLTEYSYIDYDVCDAIVYYKLKQVDYDGTYKEYDPIAFKCRSQYLHKDFYDVLGRKVKLDYDGIKLYQK